ncbi:MAG: tRNA lysidine(34) synthetase TilS [Oscillospiraceae bacterium]|nr:tRNA lysidine(34) synthetase TilS [Oscillospiraceae bacterium]
MNSKALSTLRRFNMLERGDRVIAAVSGGADSMALLCFLLEIKEEYSLSISVCHVNHLLRGEEAERDQNFVRDFCDKNALPFYLLRCDISSLAKERGIGFEECGRDVRYGFFDETAKKLGGAKIATAHTLSDCSETLIFNLARGTSPAGLASIAPIRGNIIRPLIECTRNEVEYFLASISQKYITDSTNSDTAYTRNFIRAEIIPALKKLNPSFEAAVQNLTELSREDSHFIKEKSDELYAAISKNGGIDRNLFLKADKALRRRIIAKLFTENNVMLQKKTVDEILAAAENGDFCINVKKDTFIVCRDSVIGLKGQAKPQKAEYEIPACLGAHPLPDGRILKLSLIERSEFEKIKEFSKSSLKNCIDYDIIDSGFVFRPRKSGDKIALFPRKVTKTLKKLFNEAKIPIDKRDIIPVLASKECVLWAEGIGLSCAGAVTEKTKNILFIEISKDVKNDGE